jgi:proteic killer suppression protein
LRRILAILDSAAAPADLQGFPGLRPHRLKGEYAGYWSVTVSGNRRLVFRFEGEDVTDVHLVDYH